MDDDGPSVIIMEYEEGWIVPMIFGGVQPEGQA